MLTIKIVYEDGTEFVHEARDIVFLPPNVSGNNTGHPCVTYIDISGNNINIDRSVRVGEVYVMNNYGKTVASYMLGTPMAEKTI